MPDKLKMAVVGCGYWGPNLVRNFDALAGSEVRAVCDASEERREHMVELYPALQTYADFDEMLGREELDAVAVATPIRTHYALAKKALEAGKHVFVEKPLAPSVEECQDLIDIARSRDLTLMVGHTFIYSPPVRFMREKIRSGELGDIHYISSARLNLGLFQKDINVTWDLAPHDLSIILYLMGSQPTAVNCQGQAHVTPGLEDVTSMSLDFANGTFVTIQSSWLHPNKVRNMTIVGSRRMIVYDDIEPMEKIKIYDKRVEAPPHYDTFGEFQYSYHYGDMQAPYIRQVETLKVLAQHFLDCISTDVRCESGGPEGLEVVRLLAAASDSLKCGGRRIEILAD